MRNRTTEYESVKNKSHYGNSEQMDSAVLVAPRRIEIKRVPLPEPKEGEVRIRLEGCGICSSNLPVWEGKPWFEYPFGPGALGHEGWGIVDAVGESVKNVVIGQRVSAISYNAYAQYDIAPETMVVPIPEDLANTAVPGEPLGCAVNIFNRSEISAGQNVAIVGIGFLGALLTAMVSKAGANVIAISRRQCALDIASSFGASEIIAWNENIVEQVKSRSGGTLCERVIEAVGLQHSLDLASEIIGERGKLIVAGYHQDGNRTVNMQNWNWKGIDVINAHERDSQQYVNGIRLAIEMMQQGKIDPSPLFTHTFELEEIAKGFEMMEKRPNGFMKALVKL